MACPKCAGLLVQEEIHEQSGRFQGWRCIQCGLRLDTTIVHNRLRPHPGEAPDDPFAGDTAVRPARLDRKRRPVAS
jgi:hypothetical protein